MGDPMANFSFTPPTEAEIAENARYLALTPEERAAEDQRKRDITNQYWADKNAGRDGGFFSGIGGSFGSLEDALKSAIAPIAPVVAPIAAPLAPIVEQITNVLPQLPPVSLPELPPVVIPPLAELIPELPPVSLPELPPVSLPTLSEIVNAPSQVIGGVGDLTGQLSNTVNQAVGGVLPAIGEGVSQVADTTMGGVKDLLGDVPAEVTDLIDRGVGSVGDGVSKLIEEVRRPIDASGLLNVTGDTDNLFANPIGTTINNAGNLIGGVTDIISGEGTGRFQDAIGTTIGAATNPVNEQLSDTANQINRDLEIAFQPAINQGHEDIANLGESISGIGEALVGTGGGGGGGGGSRYTGPVGPTTISWRNPNSAPGYYQKPGLGSTGDQMSKVNPYAEFLAQEQQLNQQPNQMPQPDTSFGKATTQAPQQTGVGGTSQADVNFGYDQYGYPIGAGFQSIRGATGELLDPFKLNPGMMDQSKYVDLINQQKAQGLDVASKQALTNAGQGFSNAQMRGGAGGGSWERLAQQAADSAAGTQQGIRSQANQDILKTGIQTDQFNLGAANQAQAGNVQAGITDVNAMNRYLNEQYANEIKKRQGVDTMAALPG